MLSLRYSDPPETDTEMQERQKNNGAEPKVNVDITDYVQKYTWGGDDEQAARKLEFSIAYNTKAKDEVFEPLDLKLGGLFICFIVRMRRRANSRFLRGAYSTASVQRIRIRSRSSVLMT